MAAGPPLDELMTALQRLGRLFASRQISSRITTVAGVEISQQGVALLRVLLREGRQSVNSLAASASMDLGAVSRQVRQLEHFGAVRRSRYPDDGRVVLVELTPSGRRAAERIRAVGVSHLEAALDGWSVQDQRTLARLMQRLVDDLVATPVVAAARSEDR
jgi:DNA-binding MarR family transcriptional regulator